MARDILDLQARGDIGTASDTAYAQLGYGADFTLGAEICSGFRLALAANLQANGSAGVEFAEFIQAALEVEAGVEIRAELAAQLSPDLTDVFGLHVVAAAQLKAYIRARLAVGISLGELISNTLKDRNGELGLEDRLLLALVDRISLEMGVEASAELSISAAAMISARINLQPEYDMPGFDFRIAAGAGFLYGTDLSVFLRGRLPTLESYLDDAIVIVTDKIFLQNDLAAMRIAGTGLSTSARMVAASLNADSDLREATTNEAMLDLLNEVTATTIEAVIDTALNEAMSEMLGRAVLVPESLQDQAARLIQGDNVPELTEILIVLAQFAELAGEPIQGQAEPPLVQVSAALYALMFLTVPAAPLFDQPLPPHVIRAAGLPANQNRFISPIESISLLDGGFLNNYINKLPAPFNAIVQSLLSALNQSGLGFGAFIHGKNIDTETLNLLARHFTNDVISQVMVPEVDKQLLLLSQQGELSPVMSDLIRALLHGTAKLLIPVLSELAVEQDAKKKLILQKKLAHYAAQIAATSLVQQVTEICAVFFEASVRDFDRRIDQMRDEISAPNGDFAARLVAPILGELSKAIPGSDLRRNARRSEMLRIVTLLALDLCDAGQEAFGQQTWTSARIDRLAGAIQSATTGTGEQGIDWINQSSTDLRHTIDALAKCPQLVGTLKDTVDAVGQDLTEIGMAQARVFLLRVPMIISRHIPDLARELALVVIEESLDYLAERAAEEFEKAKGIIANVEARLTELAEELETAINDVIDALDDLRAATLEWAEALIDDLIAGLDFGDINIFDRIGAAIQEFFGIDNIPITDEASARQAMRQLKSKLSQRLDEDTFYEAKTTALASRHLNTSDMRAQHQRILANLFTTEETAMLKNMPLKEGASFDNAGQNKLGVMNSSVTKVQDQLVTMEAKYLQTESQTSRLVAWQARRDAFIAQKLQAKQAYRSADSIRFLSPLTVNPSPDNGRRPADLPIYSSLVHLAIDFGSFPLDIIDHAPDVSYSEISTDRFGQVAEGADIMKDLLNRGIFAVERDPLIDIRLFVNGEEVALQSLKREGSCLSATLSESVLVQGRNHVLLSVTAPTEISGGKSIVHHVTFLRSPKSEHLPSNVVEFDRAETVIDTKGNDHKDARRHDNTDREAIVIRNRSDSLGLELDDWVIEDAHGHVFRFPRNTKLPAQSTIKVIIGPSSSPGQLTWIEDYGYGPIALLNNNGERLLLRNPDGTVVSQFFSGSPESNPDINIVGKRTA